MRPLAVDILLAAGTACQLLCCAGVLACRDAFDRLHYSAAATTVGPVLIAGAIVVREGTASPTLGTVVAVALPLLASPLLTHATAIAARRVEVGQVGPTDRERREARS